ncbi:hypothetical protein BGY98DRAFT_1179713 [Russula aff. rugulosa BPL654]|nr:hypothetical protein BGY98DRAFT_1179713 [Russula aff. rugulosa BPL654]
MSLALLILKFRGRAVAVFRDRCADYDSVISVARRSLRPLQLLGPDAGDLILLASIPGYPDTSEVELTREVWPTVSSIVHSVTIALETEILSAYSESECSSTVVSLDNARPAPNQVPSFSGNHQQRVFASCGTKKANENMLHPTKRLPRKASPLDRRAFTDESGRKFKLEVPDEPPQIGANRAEHITDVFIPIIIIRDIHPARSYDFGGRTVPNWGRTDHGNATEHRNQIEVECTHNSVTSVAVVCRVVNRLNAEDSTGTYEWLGRILYSKIEKRKLGRFRKTRRKKIKFLPCRV